MRLCEAFSDESNSDAPVRGFLHASTNPGAACLILTHGAGASCASALLTALADAFGSEGWAVLCCDLPFRQSRPHGPPLRGGAERDRAGLRAAVAAMRRLTTGPIFLGGHSYGGRQASMVAAAGPKLVNGLLLLSYPLHPPNKPGEQRTNHFPSLQTPTLFVHGTRDGFGTMSEMESALRLIPTRTELVPIAGAGHKLISKGNRADLIQQVTSRFFEFVRPSDEPTP